MVIGTKCLDERYGRDQARRSLLTRWSSVLDKTESIYEVDDHGRGPRDLRTSAFQKVVVDAGPRDLITAAFGEVLVDAGPRDLRRTAVFRK
jgi:hypothetical protein